MEVDDAVAPEVVHVPEAPARRGAWIEALGLYLTIAGAIALVVWVGAHYAVPGLVDYGPTPYWGSDALHGWVRYDAGWYMLIVAEGYWYNGPAVQSSVAFFPGYPIAIWVLHNVTQIPPQVAGMLVTFTSGAGVAILFFSWCRRKMSPGAAWTALVVLLVYPYAWYLVGAIYGDALFILGVLGAFMLLEKEHPIWAGLVGAVATATRPVGIALVIGLVAVVAFKRHVITRDEGRPRIHLRRFRPSDAGVLLSVTGLLGWMTYLWVRFGEPLAFQKVQQAAGWDQGSGPHTWFKIIFLQRLRRFPEYVGNYIDLGTDNSWRDLLYTSGIILQAALMLGALLLLIVVWRRFGWGYAVFAGAVLLIPLLGSKDFQGTGRYLLAAFPCFAALGLLLDERPRLRMVWFPLSVAALVFFAFMFGRGFYVA